MSTKAMPLTVLDDWKTILGDEVEIDDESAWRHLWPVTAEDGAQYFLKRPAWARGGICQWPMRPGYCGMWRCKAFQSPSSC